MAEKDRGRDKTRRKGAKPGREQTETTKPAHPKETTKPDVQTNDPSQKGPPKGH